MTDKQDILERLQSLSRSRGLLTDADRSTTSEAATEIEALRERVRELEGESGPSRFGSPPEPVFNPSAEWVEAYAVWYNQGS